MSRNPTMFETAFETYEQVSVLGEGGSGRVFLVADSTGRKFALKCLYPNLATSEKKKRFKNEIDFCHKHEHDNIINVIDVGLIEWDGKRTPFYVMPVFPLTLRSLIDKGISQNKVLPLFDQMLSGVEAAHLLGVFHRDLKPENFLYDPEKDLLVTADFGIAHFAEELVVTAIETKTTAKMANLGYSAPEQRKKGATVDHRADIYALGLILNEMFTREVPHGSKPKTISSVTPEFSYLDDLVDHMIRQSADDRPPTLQEVKKELIGHKNTFVALQHLESTKHKVVRSADPTHVMPVNLMGCDWSQNNLILKLDRVPEPGWISRFKDPRGGYGAVKGADPGAFQFINDTATVHASSENVIPNIIDYFKIYLEMATKGYQKDVNDETARKEEEERDRLEREIKEAEKRKRILESIKI